MTQTENNYNEVLKATTEALNFSFHEMQKKNPEKLKAFKGASNFIEYEDNNGERKLWFYDMIEAPNTFGLGISNECFRFALQNYYGPVKIYMSSSGGNALEARLISNFIRRRQEEDNQEFTVVIDGVVGSAATFIACVANRVIGRADIRYAIHRANLQVSGNAETLAELIENVLLPLDNEIAEMYVAKTGLDRSRVDELMRESTIMDGRTALELGFIDELIEDVDEEQTPAPEEEPQEPADPEDPPEEEQPEEQPEEEPAPEPAPEEEEPENQISEEKDDDEDNDEKDDEVRDESKTLKAHRLTKNQVAGFKNEIKMLDASFQVYELENAND